MSYLKKSSNGKILSSYAFACIINGHCCIKNGKDPEMEDKYEETCWKGLGFVQGSQGGERHCCKQDYGGGTFFSEIIKWTDWKVGICIILREIAKGDK